MILFPVLPGEIDPPGITVIGPAQIFIAAIQGSQILLQFIIQRILRRIYHIGAPLLRGIQNQMVIGLGRIQFVDIRHGLAAVRIGNFGSKSIIAVGNVGLFLIIAVDLH